MSWFGIIVCSVVTGAIVWGIEYFAARSFDLSYGLGVALCFGGATAFYLIGRYVCQSALNFDPRSASNIDPSGLR